jgi:hypothetical protein
MLHEFYGNSKTFVSCIKELYGLLHSSTLIDLLYQLIVIFPLRKRLMLDILEWVEHNIRYPQLVNKFKLQVIKVNKTPPQHIKIKEMQTETNSFPYPPSLIMGNRSTHHPRNGSCPVTHRIRICSVPPDSDARVSPLFRSPDDG